MKPVVWTERVLAQLEAIRDHISQVSPVYADHMIARIFSRRDQISRFPESGRIVPEADDPAIREVIEWPYRIITESAVTESRCLQSCTVDAAISEAPREDDARRAAIVRNRRTVHRGRSRVTRRPKDLTVITYEATGEWQGLWAPPPVRQPGTVQEQVAPVIDINKRISRRHCNRSEAHLAHLELCSLEVAVC